MAPRLPCRVARRIHPGAHASSLVSSRVTRCGILSLPIPFLGQKSSRANRSSMIFSEAKRVRSVSLLSLSRHPPCGIPVHFSRSPCESDCPPSHCFLAPGIPVSDSPRVHPDRDILSLVVDYSHTSRILPMQSSADPQVAPRPGFDGRFRWTGSAGADYSHTSRIRESHPMDFAGRGMLPESDGRGATLWSRHVTR